MQIAATKPVYFNMRDMQTDREALAWARGALEAGAPPLLVAAEIKEWLEARR